MQNRKNRLLRGGTYWVDIRLLYPTGCLDTLFQMSRQPASVIPFTFGRVCCDLLFSGDLVAGITAQGCVWFHIITVKWIKRQRLAGSFENARLGNFDYIIYIASNRYWGL